jgi:aspartyl/glutamyl-tRNA(Asn/Gln) amidotransferase C subunit
MALREDRVESSLPRDDALRNAPVQKNGFFRVPKVIPVNTQNPKNHKNRKG